MLARWDPIQELTELTETLDRFFGSRFGNGQPRGDMLFPLDLIEREDSFLIKADLPGLTPEDLDISFSNDVLTIRGELKPEQAEQPSHFLLRERCPGQFRRSFRLPAAIQADEIQAQFEAGVLTLTLPKVQEARPKRIPIQAGAQQKRIEEQAAETA